MATTRTRKTATATAAQKAAKAPASNTVLQDVQKLLQAKTLPASPEQPKAQAEGASVTPPEQDIQRYIDALSQANGFAKASIDLEMAVCLMVFAEQGGAGINEKKAVYKVYAGAGWKCETHAGPDYKTVSRRLNAAAALFDKMGGSKVIGELLAAIPPEAQIGALVQHLATNFELTSLNAVWAAAGRPVKNERDWTYTERVRGENAGGPGQDRAGQPLINPPTTTSTKAPSPEELRAAEQVAGQQIDASNATILKAGQLTLAIPHGTPYDDVVDMITELMAFAQNMKPQEHQEPAPAAKTTSRGRQKETTH